MTFLVGFRGKNGWFTEREEYILVNRLLREGPSKGDMNNRQAVGPKILWKAVKDWEMWLLYIIGLTAYIPPALPSTYLALILRQLGFSVFQANLLTIPSQFLFAVNLIIFTWISKKIDERSILSSISNIWMLPFFVALVALPVNTSTWIRYGLLSGILFLPLLPRHPGWGGNMIGTNIYRDDDKPLHIRGNKIILGIVCFNIVLMYLVKAFYLWQNKVVRARAWDARTTQEQDDYIVNTKDEGLKRLDFRFAH
ncbi:ophD encodes a permease for phthalate transporter [Podospora appendiculata]|uniref:OphD encodes a permease for phthalate transporter n=1 Tax=Podospora appendiculata TaxID=314037 RepID=A0AAE1CB54_9PEZI|nr:ophD encodes a permease for phthalate transporter [Podospora appendiculata]